MDLLKTLKELGIPAQTGQIYVELLRKKRATARQLALSLGMPRPSIYDHLKLLINKGIVVEFEINNKKFFEPENPQRIIGFLRKRIESLEHEELLLKKELPRLRESPGGVEPKIKFYEGADAFLRALQDVLWFPDVELCVLWPFRHMEEVAGDEELALFTKRRVAERITVRSIWPAEHAALKLVIPLEETRIAPPGLSWRMGYLVYLDNVAFISSRQENFAFIVTSRDFADLIRMQFELVWKLSTPRGGSQKAPRRRHLS